MRTIETVVYSFGELSEDTKEKAIDNVRNYGFLDYEWWDCTLDAWKQCLGIIGFDVESIYFNVGYSQSDYASIEGTYKYKKQWQKALKQSGIGGKMLKALSEYGERLQKAQSLVFYTGYCSVSSNHRGGMCFDIEVEKGDFGEFETDVEDIINELCQDIYYSLMEEYDFLNSDENIRETILCNEMEFTKGGGIA